jgi:hypothetical protein
MVPETNPTVRGRKVKIKSAAIIRVAKAVTAVRVVQVVGAEEMAAGAAAPVDSVELEAASAVAVDLEAVAAVAETITAETTMKERATTSNFQRRFPTFSITSTSVNSAAC